MRPPTSLHEKHIGGPQNFQPPVQNDFCNRIDPKRHFSTVNCRTARMFIRTPRPEGEERRRHANSDSACGLHIYREREPRWFFERQIGILVSFRMRSIWSTSSTTPRRATLAPSTSRSDRVIVLRPQEPT